MNRDTFREMCDDQEPAIITHNLNNREAVSGTLTRPLCFFSLYLF